MWGEAFPLGGISGVPFVGKTGFKAFSQHAPDGGNIFLMYGPHISVDKDGRIGQYTRQRPVFIDAYNQCCAGRLEDNSDDEQDMQQSWLRERLAAVRSDIQQANEPMASLAVHMFEI